MLDATSDQRETVESYEGEVTMNDDARSERMTCGHPKWAWVATKPEYPTIPSYLKNSIVFMDKNLGICLVADYGGAQWIHKITNGKWMTVRKVDERDPFLVPPLPESGYCSICREIQAAVADEAEWWHQQLHRSLGVPCDMTYLPQCKRLEDIRMPEAGLTKSALSADTKGKP